MADNPTYGIPDLAKYVDPDADIEILAMNIVKFAIAIHSQAVVAHDTNLVEESEAIWAWADQIERKAGNRE